MQKLRESKVGLQNIRQENLLNIATLTGLTNKHNDTAVRICSNHKIPQTHPLYFSG
jgi:hypothetical protein